MPSNLVHLDLNFPMALPTSPKADPKVEQLAKRVYKGRRRRHGGGGAVPDVVRPAPAGERDAGVGEGAAESGPRLDLAAAAPDSLTFFIPAGGRISLQRSVF